MDRITVTNDSASIDARVLARAFGLDEANLKQQMRRGAITSRFEKGAEQDAGKVRLTFFSNDRRVQVVADHAGKVLHCTTMDSPPSASRSEQTGRHKAENAGEKQRARLDALLDAALDDTFPASDPVAIHVDASR
ncbi:DUF6522 family protein [Elongatibacter sediminis]|uniref:DUF6522 family protein n=1 Tax=Elongatibacter sediminis TaxID=3119006 RepID=A0AAW9R4T9_9GAMM